MLPEEGTRIMRPTLPMCIHCAGVSVIALAFALAMPSRALAAATPQEILFQSSELKIYRTTSPRGTPVVVLTNLDALGNRLAPTSDAEVCAGDKERVPAVSTGSEGHGATTTSSGSVKVVVNQGGGEAPVDERNVEVTTDGPGGTTVIININPPASPEKETAVVPPSLVYPVVAIGGLPGAYRYPDHLYFLGYGPDTSSPSWFGGLGLNAGNGFGLSNGTPCTHGFDCMFGPKAPRP